MRKYSTRFCAAKQHAIPAAIYNILRLPYLLPFHARIRHTSDRPRRDTLEEGFVRRTHPSGPGSHRRKSSRRSSRSTDLYADRTAVRQRRGRRQTVRPAGRGADCHQGQPLHSYGKTTCSSKMLANFRVPYDATVVQKAGSGRGGDPGENQSRRICHGEFDGEFAPSERRIIPGI